MKLAKLWKSFDEMKRLYLKVALLASLIHIVYTCIFIAFSMKVLIIYNLFSTIFYALLTIAAYKQKYRFVVTAVHAEVALFVTVFSLYGGMGLGIGMLLLSMAALIYFCPFKHKRVPYFFAFGEAILYVVLRIYHNYFTPENAFVLSLGEKTSFHILNACVSFVVILFAALLTDAENMLVRKKLTRENKALKQLANYDDLTGLQSRYFFTSRCEKINSGTDMSVAIGDIDDFKNINDTYGHLCGDYVLQIIADLIRRSLDPERVDICRWGGEEFVCLFHEDSFDDSCDRLETLRKRIENYNFEYDGISFHLTMTFGIAAVPNKKFNMKALDAADRLLYRGKHQGKNCVVK